MEQQISLFNHNEKGGRATEHLRVQFGFDFGGVVARDVSTWASARKADGHDPQRHGCAELWSTSENTVTGLEGPTASDLIRHASAQITAVRNFWKSKSGPECKRNYLHGTVMQAVLYG